MQPLAKDSALDRSNGNPPGTQQPAEALHSFAGLGPVKSPQETPSHDKRPR